MNRIQEDVNELKNALVNLSNTQENVIELKEIPIEEAKAQVLSYLEAHEYSLTSEIAEALGIDYLVINKALHELKEEGVLDSRSE